MKKLSKLLLTLFAGLVLTGTAFAESATRDECITQCKLAADMILKDKSGAIAEIGNKEGKFVWKDTYVFLMDLQGNMLAHPIIPQLTQKGSLLGVTDKNKKSPKMLFVEFVEVASTSGEGWVDYLWPKPRAKEASEKSTYIYRVPGTEMFVGAGIYN